MEFKSPTGRSHVHSIPIGERLRNSLSLSFAICKVGTGAGGGRSDKSWAPVPAVHQPILTPTQQDPHQTWWAWHPECWGDEEGHAKRGVSRLGAPSPSSSSPSPGPGMPWGASCHSWPWKWPQSSPTLAGSPPRAHAWCPREDGQVRDQPRRPHARSG